MSSGTQGPASLIGQTIGGYQLESVLGTGATGAIFLARRVDGAPAVQERTQDVPVTLPVEAGDQDSGAALAAGG